MKKTLSYSELFSSLEEIISHLVKTNAPPEYIDALTQIQKSVLALELLNISVQS